MQALEIIGIILMVLGGFFLVATLLNFPIVDNNPKAKFFIQRWGKKSWRTLVLVFSVIYLIAGYLMYTL